MTATSSPPMNQVYAEAYRLAASGLGWEDLVARLGKQGITREAAKIIVLGKRK
jgi:hypothetical protein